MKRLISLCLTSMLLLACVTVFAADPTPTLPSGTTISTSPGAFSVSFSGPVDESVLDTISLTTDGETIKGGFYPEISANGQTVVIKYGLLEHGKEYTLTIAGQSKTYTAEGYEFLADFEGNDYVVGEAPPTDKGITWTNPSSAGKVLVKQENGTKYIRIEQSDNVNQDITARIEFAQPLSNEVVIAEMKVRPTNAEGVKAWGRYIFRTKFKEFSAGTQSLITNAPSNKFTVQPNIQNVTVSGAINTNGGLSESGVDENGFYHIEVVYKKGADNKYQKTVRNKISPDEGSLVLTGTQTATAIENIILAGVTTWGTKGDGATWLDIDDLKITAGSMPDVLYTDIDKLDRNESEFDIVFTADIEEESVKEIALVDASGNPVGIAFKEYDAANRRATYTLNEYLKSGVAYTLDMAGVTDALGTVLKSATYTFNAAETDGGEITVESVKNGSDVALVDNKLNGATSVKLAVDAVNTSGKTSDFILAAVICDASGRIVKLETDIAEDVADGATADLDLTTVTPLGENYSVKRIVLRLDSDNGAISIAPTMVLK